MKTDANPTSTPPEDRHRVKFASLLVRGCYAPNQGDDASLAFLKAKNMTVRQLVDTAADVGRLSLEQFEEEGERSCVNSTS
jgi:hypothetical protein